MEKKEKERVKEGKREEKKEKEKKKIESEHMNLNWQDYNKKHMKIKTSDDKLELFTAFVDKQRFKVLRDSETNTLLVYQNYVEPHLYIGKTGSVKDFKSNIRTHLVTIIYIDIPYFSEMKMKKKMTIKQMK
ncbi:hypothetical protein HELRODRAFT_175884 [Helobdella robusta]|uniref:Uncharacterized protein n=1 Tax=Helobdella robusta TaxID=6412 RepID=T1F9U0_HELRO|nr:hypothetical protein HELRODRAFT_175884 [Helobdella robusta]ESO00451.1 hypothetical protein HELRODRAFT_175884 [Helobdella robusta]